VVICRTGEKKRGTKVRGEREIKFVPSETLSLREKVHLNRNIRRKKTKEEGERRVHSRRLAWPGTLHWDLKLKESKTEGD